MSNAKIFFSDLDGTLIDNHQKLSPRMREAIIHFIAEGNYFSICTGRSIYSSKKIFKTFNIEKERFYISCFNGGIIYDCEKDTVIARKTMDIDDVETIFNMFNEENVDCQTYSDTHIITNEDNEGLRHFLIIENDPHIITSDIKSVLEVPPCKIVGIDLHDKDKLRRMRTLIEEHFKGKYYCVFSAETYLEVLPAGSGKGSSVTALSNALGVNIENTIAAGDNENDVSMLKVAGLGIALKNATPEAKAAADVITEFDNIHDGLYPYFF